MAVTAFGVAAITVAAANGNDRSKGSLLPGNNVAVHVTMAASQQECKATRIDVIIREPVRVRELSNAILPHVGPCNRCTECVRPSRNVSTSGAICIAVFHIWVPSKEGI